MARQREPLGTWHPRKAGGGAWRIRIGPRGDQRWVDLTDQRGALLGRDATRAQRRAAVVRVREAQRRSEENEALGWSLAEAAGAYLTWCRGQAQKPRTIRDKEIWLQRLCNHVLDNGSRLADLPVIDLTVNHVRSAEEGMLATAEATGQSCSPGYRRHLYDEAKSLCAWLARPIPGREPIRVLERNPLEKAIMPPPSRAKRPVLDPETVAAILDRIDAHIERSAKGLGPRQKQGARRWALCLRLIAETGARPSEALAVRGDQWVDPPGGFVLSEHKTDRTGALRLLLPTRATADRLRERIAAGGPERYLFGTDDRPGHYAALKNWWRRTRIVLGLDPALTLYTFRYAASNRFRRAGAAGRVYTDSLGHSEPVGDRIYAQQSLEWLAAEQERLGLR